MHEEYLTYFHQLDPLHPDHFRSDDLRLVRMDSEIRQQNQAFSMILCSQITWLIWRNIYSP